MRLLGHAAAALVIVAAVVGCSNKESLDPGAEAKRIAFCATVIDVVTPDNKICGPYLAKAREYQSQQQAAALAAEASKPKPADPDGWKESEYPGIYWRWCSTKTGCTSDKVIGDNMYALAQVWCKQRPCGDIYARVNLISSGGVVVGWTNDTGYGGMGQKVQLTFDSHQADWDSVQLVELNIRI